jgi:hypothetical protein
MLDAFGFEHPSQLLRTAIASILKLRGLTLRFLPPHQQSQFFSDSPIRSYPNGYEIANLGPPENK